MSAGADRAVLVLEDGAIFEGQAWGARGQALGEAVFNTSMTGYQEIITDPACHRQILVMTSPHIGVVGVNAEDAESGRVWAAGLVARAPSARASNFRSEGTLEENLIRDGVVAMGEVDTRALTSHLREHGTMRAGIFSGHGLRGEAGRELTTKDMLVIVRWAGGAEGADLAGEVTTDKPYTIEPTTPTRATLAVLDLGVRRGMVESMVQAGIRVIVWPRQTSYGEIEAAGADGLFCSSGPGDPAASKLEVATVREALTARMPVFGVGLGCQILGRALGFETYKLKVAHRGANQPVRQTSSGSVATWVHNHGFALKIPPGPAVVAPYGDGRFGRVAVTHVSVDDEVVEGFECHDLRAFAVQFLPRDVSGFLLSSP